MKTIDEAVARADFGRPTARNTGRRDGWPFVPVVEFAGRTEQIRGRAFETRDEAIGYAAGVIDARRELLRKHLGERRYRALRAIHGLPFENAIPTRWETTVLACLPVPRVGRHVRMIGSTDVEDTIQIVGSMLIRQARRDRVEIVGPVVCHIEEGFGASDRIVLEARALVKTNPNPFPKIHIFTNRRNRRP